MNYTRPDMLTTNELKNRIRTLEQELEVYKNTLVDRSDPEKTGWRFRYLGNWYTFDNASEAYDHAAKFMGEYGPYRVERFYY